MIIHTVEGLDANLDEEHWVQHILIHHPELNEKLAWIIETLKEPNFVHRSKRDPETRIYIRTYHNVQIGEQTIPELSLRVYVREPNGFVVMAYFSVATFRSLGEKIWPS